MRLWWTWNRGSCLAFTQNVVYRRPTSCKRRTVIRDLQIRLRVRDWVRVRLFNSSFQASHYHNTYPFHPMSYSLYLKPTWRTRALETSLVWNSKIVLVLDLVLVVQSEGPYYWSWGYVLEQVLGYQKVLHLELLWLCFHSMFQALSSHSMVQALSPLTHFFDRPHWPRACREQAKISKCTSLAHYATEQWRETKPKYRYQQTQYSAVNISKRRRKRRL